MTVISSYFFSPVEMMRILLYSVWYKTLICKKISAIQQEPSMKRSVIGIVFEEDTKNILLIKRRDVPVWVLPGGGVEYDEKPEDAVIREVFEETGIQTIVIRKIGEYTPLNKLAHFTEVFECRKIGGNLAISDESLSVAYWPSENLPSTFFFLHQDWLEDAFLPITGVICKDIHQITYANLCRYFCRHPLHVLRFMCSRLGFPLNSKGSTTTPKSEME